MHAQLLPDSRCRLGSADMLLPFHEPHLQDLPHHLLSDLNKGERECSALYTGERRPGLYLPYTQCNEHLGTT